MDPQFLPSYYALVGEYLGVGDIIRNGEVIQGDVARVKQRDMVYVFEAGMEPVFTFLRTCPTIPEYEEWYAETDGPWGEEDLAGILSSMGYLVTISPSTFLNKEFSDMLTVVFVEIPEHDIPPTHVENVESLAQWYSLVQHRSFADMRNHLLLNEGKTLSEVDEFFGREVPALLRSRIAFLSLAEKRQRQDTSITSITL